MVKNEDIICISSIDWDFLWQGHQEIMSRLARSGNRVLFIENTGVRAPKISDIGRIRKRFANWRKGIHGIRKISERLYVYSPIVLPFPYLRLARFINKRLVFSVLLKWLNTVGFSEPIVWAFLPTGLSIDLIDRIEPKALIYYCIDSFQASSRDARKIRESEKHLIEKADVVFVTSEELFKHCRQYTDKVHLFPFGVSVENFRKALIDKKEPPADMRNIKKPIVGYIGGIHKWIDFDLLSHMARSLKDVSFVFCGQIQVDISRFKELPNVMFLGKKNTEDLPLYIREFDVAIIPYRITEYTNNVYPTKMNEYLLLGKRVVSTPLVEVEKFNRENGGIVRIASTDDGFCDEVRRAITDPPDDGEKHSAISAAEKNSWTVKLGKMSELIKSIIDEKARQRELSWQTNLSRLYRKARNRVVPIAAAMALIYLLVFHTPLLWVAAKPLGVTSVPQKADVIAVLGGGVGESGKVGEGYQERVQSAVKLYDKGFARNILFVSGYKYLMKEAYVMKTLSIAMGVPQGSVTVDDKSVNTYEMVKNLEELCRTKLWKSVILVSSPYHMLRLKLLCEKQLKDVVVYYLPVEESSYYSRGSSVTIKQIEGILKEYIAIIYYRFKGYL